MFRYLCHDTMAETIKYHPVGSVFDGNGVINGIVTGHQYVMNDPLSCWLMYSADKPDFKGCCEYMTQEIGPDARILQRWDNGNVSCYSLGDALSCVRTDH